MVIINYGLFYPKVYWQATTDINRWPRRGRESHKYRKRTNLCSFKATKIMSWKDLQLFYFLQSKYIAKVLIHSYNLPAIYLGLSSSPAAIMSSLKKKSSRSFVFILLSLYSKKILVGKVKIFSKMPLWSRSVFVLCRQTLSRWWFNLEFLYVPQDEESLCLCSLTSLSIL